MEAAANPQSGYYHAGCMECSARMLAQGPEHWEAMAVSQFTPRYAAALKAVFGKQWQQGHERVRAWSKKIKGKDAA
jgi:hypothetical protein